MKRINICICPKIFFIEVSKVQNECCEVACILFVFEELSMKAEIALLR